MITHLKSYTFFPILQLFSTHDLVTLDYCPILEDFIIKHPLY